MIGEYTYSLIIMPRGKGTYGTKKGRPPKKGK